MKTLILLNWRRLAKSELDQILKIKPCRIVAIYSASAAKEELTDATKRLLDASHIVPTVGTESIFQAGTLSEKAVQDIIMHELEHLGQQPEKIRIACNDELSMTLLGRLHDEFHIPGLSEDILLAYRDKHVMKDRLQMAGIRIPKNQHLHIFEPGDPTEAYLKTLMEEYQFPIVIKPTAGVGSLDTTIVRDFTTLKTIYEHCRQASNIAFEVNEYIEGTVYHCDTIVQNGTVIFQVASEYLYPNITYSQQNKPITSLLLKSDDPLRKRLQTFASEVLNTLGHINSMTHMELFYTPQDEIVFLEVCARPPGSATLPAYERMFNFNALKAMLMCTLDIEITPPLKDPDIYCFGGRVPYKKGEVIALHEPTLQSQSEWRWTINPGDTIPRNSTLTREYAAEFFVWNTDYNQLKADFETVRQFNGYIEVIPDHANGAPPTTNT